MNVAVAGTNDDRFEGVHCTIVIQRPAPGVVARHKPRFRHVSMLVANASE